jgi:2-deoxy-D-gluconate 3-dehydrogenase
MFDIKNKNIIVTGANGGNGFCIADGLLKAGANVIGIDKSFNRQDIEFETVTVDLTNFKEVKNSFDNLTDKFGTITGLVNNAGVSFASDTPYEDYDIYDQTIRINLNSVFNLTALFCNKIKDDNYGMFDPNKEWSSVVNITSLGASLGFPNNPSYQISKAGLDQLTIAFACDWSKYNIRFNNICPGYIKTPMTQKSYDNQLLRYERTKRTMLNRWGESKDLLGASIFLLSNASSYITASTINVDGGWLAKGF